MEIDWFGHACFRVRGREGTVITDPYSKAIGLHFARPRGDIVTISHPHPGHSFAQGVKGDPKILAGPGEYEIQDVFVTGVAAAHDKKNGKERGTNTIYVLELEGLTVCHLGDLGHIPSQTQIEALGNVNILLVPVGGVSTINGSEAAEIVALLEPHIVIPMHYAHADLTFKLDPPAKFFKAMGIQAPEPVASLKVTRDSLPSTTQVIVLTAKQKEG